MSRLRAFVITAVFLGLIAYEEGTGSAMNYVEGGLLALLWAAGIYLNLWWIANRIPKRVYTVPSGAGASCWNRTPDPVSLWRPW